MIRRIRRSLWWFGAIAALLLFPLPVQADDIEPEPYVDENLEPEPEPKAETAVQPAAATETAVTRTGPSVGSKIYDCLVLRPFGFVATLIGGALFVPAALLSLPGGADSVDIAWQTFVGSQVKDTFKRPLGDF
jgi:hypothetical protein